MTQVQVELHLAATARRRLPVPLWLTLLARNPKARVGFLVFGTIVVVGLISPLIAAPSTATNFSFATRQVVKTWPIPGGSPDMGNVSASGRVLWLSGRYDNQVYAIDTRTGKLLARVPVGAGPHGVCVWPQPGRYSLGHTGIMR